MMIPQFWPSGGLMPQQGSVTLADLKMQQLFSSSCVLVSKLACLLGAVAQKFSAQSNICICQAWLMASDNADTTGDFALVSPEPLAIVGDPLFSNLRSKSCQQPVYFRNSMPGKVWKSGNLQIVQNVKILPPTLHPRSQLSDEALERLAEALYIPIYDLAWPHKGQVGILEVLLSTKATETMLVAEFISFVGSMLTGLQLSISNPVPQPIRRSVLCGRRPRAPDSDDESEQKQKVTQAAGPAAGVSAMPDKPEATSSAPAAPARAPTPSVGAPAEQSGVTPGMSVAGASPSNDTVAIGAADTAGGTSVAVPACEQPHTGPHWVTSGVRSSTTAARISDACGSAAESRASEHMPISLAVPAAGEATAPGDASEHTSPDPPRRPRRRARLEEGQMPRNKSMYSVPAAASSEEL